MRGPSTINHQRSTTPPTDLRPYFLTIADILAEHGGRLDWPVFFGNDNPVEIDVGCGRGLFLVNAAQAHPEINFLGVEIDYREGRRTARRLKKRESPNARVLGGDIFVVLRSMIDAHSVAAFHAYFPDPWWKKKHRRRRVFTDRFVDLCSSRLKPAGLLHAWTDVGEYFEVMAALMNHHRDFDPLPPPPQRTPQHEMDYHTSYERKKRKLGMVIHRGRWRRRAIS